MALPETSPAIPPDKQVTEVPQVPEVPVTVQNAGVQVIPVEPKPLMNSSGTPLDKPFPLPPDDTKSLNVPVADQEALTQMAKGNPSDSQTWFGVYWLRKIKKALLDGFYIFFGKGK